MLNVFTKTKPWMVASLLVATSVFAQDNASTGSAKCRPQRSYEQGNDMMQNQMMPGYNASARIDVRGSWDFWVDGSFIYWEAMQENMELGITIGQGGSLAASSASNPWGLVNTGTVPYNLGTYVNPSFTYNPGFKVGIGMNFDHDNWDASAEYTWFHGSSTTTAAIPAGGVLYPAFGNPAVLITGTNGTGDLFGVSTDSTWNLKMDLADLDLERCFYAGNKLSYRPFFGVRGAWIRQNYSLTAVGTAAVGSNDSEILSYKTFSWGVGPRTGLNTNWMLGYGLKLLGNMEFDILYTRYNASYYEKNWANTTGIINRRMKTVQNHMDYLRTHTALELGIGWGSYFDNNNWHIDLDATYGFQAFFDQNMFRHWTSATVFANSNAPNGNLYVHGLDITARFDF